MTGLLDEYDNSASISQPIPFGGCKYADLDDPVLLNNTQKSLRISRETLFPN